MYRIVVIGSSGSGKTTLGRRLAKQLGYPLLELDSVRHQTDWEELPEEEFRARVANFALGRNWVIDGNYTSLGMPELIWPVADSLVWIDLPRSVVMRRITGRTLRRWVSREELWNGNREPFLGPFRWDPEKSVIRWAWTRYESTREKYSKAIDSSELAHLDIYRLQYPSEVEAFLNSICSVRD
jgi:adenylate kinase family enzyme